MTHFADATQEGRTLCGREWNGYVMRSNPKADCTDCQNAWVARTGWSFPLPELVDGPCNDCPGCPDPHVDRVCCRCGQPEHVECGS